MRNLAYRLVKRPKIQPRRKTDRLVNLLICGTQKGGTTALDAYLREHPAIGMAKKKEVHFFDNETIFRKRRPSYSKYHSAFRIQPSHRYMGEATPIYMYWHSAPQRIWEYNPNIKLIVVLRNPIYRAYSHWNMARSIGAERLPFYEALANERQRCREALPYQHRYFSYIDRGFYLEQLRRLWFYFSKDNVFVLKSDDLKNQPYHSLQEICEFLQIDKFKDITPQNSHKRSYPVPIGRKEKDYLLYTFEHEIRALERTLGWDCSDWLS